MIRHRNCALLGAEAGAGCKRALQTLDVILPGLDSDAEVDWSPAVLCWCKALEMEVERVVLRSWSEGTVNLGCKGAGEVSAYLRGVSERAPGLCLMAQFIGYAARRYGEGEWLRGHANRAWILAREGLAVSLREVATRYRNPAAHTGWLGRDDYLRCAGMIGGTDGVLAKLWGCHW